MVEKGMLMTVREVAELMRMNDRTILRMAQRGEIPAAKIARRWRFDRGLVASWLDSRMQGSDGEAAVFVQMEEAADFPSVAGLMKRELVSLDLAAVTRDRALEELVGLVEDAGLLEDGKAFLASLIEREELLSTALARGVAVPHSRTVPKGLFRDPVVVVGRSLQGVAFGAPDGNLTHIFFMICPPDDAAHLRLLGRVASLLRGPEVIAGLMRARSPEAVIRTIEQEERRRGGGETV